MPRNRREGLFPSRALLRVECRVMSRLLLLASMSLWIFMCLSTASTDGTEFVSEHANEWVVRIDEGE